jgi:hypothetical protein
MIYRLTLKSRNPSLRDTFLGDLTFTGSRESLEGIATSKGQDSGFEIRPATDDEISEKYGQILRDLGKATMEAEVAKKNLAKAHKIVAFFQILAGDKLL